MSTWFLLSLAGALLLTPLHFLSVEHERLDGRFGKEKGERIGGVLGIISGWGYFLFLFGIWLSPQMNYVLPISSDFLMFSLEWISISLSSFLIGLVFLIPGIWFGIKGVTDLGLKVSETHRADQIITQGVYGRVRHPQYLGAILSHIGISLMLSIFYALLITPILVIRDYIVCLKEEKELEQEFGEDYIDYKSKIPMLIPYRR
ncbi:MAG: isoprenylcysteine carboxylmethyltransferase family protein [Candidatus Thorarchaeota archaeon]|nr:isoprenylcysteine carboxylmethyltransferase family protein [Candidatus Thorarchaeota archaeon]